MWHYTCSQKRKRAAVTTQALTSLSGWFKQQLSAFARLFQLHFSIQNPQYPSAWRVIFIISKDSQNQFRNQSKNKLLSLQFLILVVWLFNLGPPRLKTTSFIPCIHTEFLYCSLLSGFHCQTDTLSTRQYLKVSSYRKFNCWGLPKREGNGKQINKQTSIPLSLKGVFSITLK